LIIPDDKLAGKNAVEKGLNITGTLEVLFKTREKGIRK
jgi:predicted nucleic acid-binding protein